MSAPAGVAAVQPGPGWARTAAECLTDTLAVHPLVTDWLLPGQEAYPLIEDLAQLIEDALDLGGSARMLEDRTGLIVWTPDPARLQRYATSRRKVVHEEYAARWAVLIETVFGSVPADALQEHLLLVLAGAGTGETASRRTGQLLAAYHHELDRMGARAHTAVFDPVLRRLLREAGWTTGPACTIPDGPAWWPATRTAHPRPTPRRRSRDAVRPGRNRDHR